LTEFIVIDLEIFTVPIKRMMYLLIAVNLVALLCMLFAAPAVLTGHELAGKLHKDRYHSYLLADELRQHSDDLTHMVRSYASTGDLRFKTYFNEIIAIADGKAPRPIDYNRPYWDYVATSDDKPRANGSEISLVELMHQAGFPKDEMELLEFSKHQSDDLVNTEIKAINANEGQFMTDSSYYTIKGEPDPELARQLLFSPAYYTAKVKIVRPLDKLTEKMEQRFDNLVEAAEDKIYKLETFLAICLFAVFASIAFTIWVVFARVISPVNSIVDAVVRVGKGDLGSKCDYNGNNELGTLSSEVNAMTDSLKDLTGSMQVSSGQLSESAANMAIATKEQEATTAEQAVSTQEIVVSSQEISQTAQVLLDNMGEVANAVDIAANMAQQGNSDLQRMEIVLNNMVSASKVISQKLAALNEKTSNISMVVTTINKVSDQTNLLSVNAAIEADKAGEAGIGFSTVASEIRRLADQTAVATWDIEQLVKEIQTAVSSGVMSMEKFHEDIDKGVDEMQQVSGKFGEIVDQVRILGPHFEAVHEGMESQSVGASQISEGISQLSETVSNLLESIRFSNQAIDEVNSEAQTLQKTCSRFRLES